jgi:carbohydrate-binding DOMON domain-containing protein
VRAGTAQITFAFQMGELPNPGGAPYGFSLPLVDVYIDINHAPGAGSSALLPGRPAETAPRDAWEYALTVDGWGARVYQFAVGGTPRQVSRLPVKAVPENKSFEVAVPRSLLRGEPGAWGYGVAVMGRSPDAAEPPVPMDVLPEPGPHQFGGAARAPSPSVEGGGAAPGAKAPPFLDILAPRGMSQSEILNVYKQGREVTLPFVREEQP